MQIQINTSDRETYGAASEEMVRDAVIVALDRYEQRITRVAVHLRDVNGPKGGVTDKQCTMEARMSGRPPVAVTADGPDLQQAVSDAAEKLSRRIEHDLGKLNQRR